MRNCNVCLCIVLLAVLPAFAQLQEPGGAPTDLREVDIGPAPDDEDCDDGNEAIACDVTRVEIDLDAAIPTATFWGTFCQDPSVGAGQTDGTSIPLLVLATGDHFVTVDLTGNEDPADVAFAIECPCANCGLHVTIAAAGPTGPTGPTDPAVLDALCDLYVQTGNPLPGICDGGGLLLTLIAVPGVVLIDVGAGETEGTTLLLAQALDGGGASLDGIPVFFTSTGGLLGSVHNVCVAGQCTRSAGACDDDDDCPVLAPEPVETNVNGVAADTLTLRVIEDPHEVIVTAHAIGASASTTVQKIVQ